MSDELDEILGLGFDDSADSKKKKKEIKDQNTKNKLDNLKEMLKSDPISLDTKAMMADPSMFPGSENLKTVDYEEEKKSHIKYAEATINMIVDNYISIPELIQSDKVKEVMNIQIMDLSKFQFVVELAEVNLTTLQESIDGGDMSKEVYDMARGYSVEFRNCIEARSKHIEKCEQYWINYNKKHALINKEEKIIEKNTNKIEEKKLTIADNRDLNDMIRLKVIEAKENMNKKNKKNKKK